ncbi:MobC family plasmid mobilization relaxosome protein (plasmid) [Pseudorhodobacter turbinis]|uniref:MobC family plasmid mobilization relaxosome protein n=1 Tax=Pseudorhodobacter turbinis TaxID=2500533 RepID=A0A4P8ELX9_9RHOB|nr:plasmid mobilization relaxosome protein MobC [Pseudorhodobacter turbinis]QCO58087.1 MobC family plasmid mobilization relaxosome protein [Pseudorhodobacter turbinis]
MARTGDGKARSSKRRTGHQLYKRVTDDELAAFIERSDAAGFTDHRDYLTAFIRGQITPYLAAKKDITLSLGHLGKIGSNLNQISRAINVGRLTNVGQEVTKAINEARTAVEKIGAEIRKALRP